MVNTNFGGLYFINSNSWPSLVTHWRITEEIYEKKKKKKKEKKKKKKIKKKKKKKTIKKDKVKHSNFFLFFFKNIYMLEFIDLKNII